MSVLKKIFEKNSGVKARLALFLSGGGSNARKIIEYARNADCAYEIAVLVTDKPESSAAETLGKENNIPVVSLDIAKFYMEHGESSIMLNTPHRRELRDLWSDELYNKIAGFKVDAGILAGFMPLSNIVGKMPCLNVHPGDLTVTENGVRILAGLHYRPVENAILRGHKALRSSVILAQNYCGDGKKEQDSGPILGVSAPVEIDLEGHSLQELKLIDSQRTAPPYSDVLRQLADHNVEKLKVQGDHVVFPVVIDHFVRGDYALDDEGRLFFNQNGKWQNVETVEFRADNTCCLMPSKVNGPQKNRTQNRFLRFIKYYYTRIVRTPGTPEFVARGWALGVAVGCIVPVFCQIIVAIPLSFLFRCSKIGAIAGTFVTTPPTAIFIYPVLIWVGNKVINGDLSSESAGQLVEIFNNESLTFAQKWQAFADLGGDLVAAFFAGGALWAAIMVPLTYFGVKKLVVSYRKLREARRIKQDQRD